MKLIISTERLYLREMTTDDAQHAFNLNNDPLVMRNTGDLPFSNLKAARAFLQIYKDYEKFGYGRWAVILKSTNEFLGWCGLKYSPELNESGLVVENILCLIIPCNYCLINNSTSHKLN